MIRRIFLVAVIAVFAMLPMAASAAEPAAYNWTGFYAGVQGMYGAGHTDWNYTNSAWLGNNNHDISGGMGGIFAGYNYQFPNNIVIGAEVEGNGGDISGVTQDPSGWDCRSNINWIASARARAGYVLFDRYLPFVTVGGAYGGIDVYTQRPWDKETFGGMQGRFGWTVGAGIEYAVSNRFRIRAEYSYYDFGSDHTNVDSGLRVDHNVHTHTAKIGVSYRF